MQTVIRAAEKPDRLIKLSPNNKSQPLCSHNIRMCIYKNTLTTFPCDNQKNLVDQAGLLMLGVHFIMHISLYGYALALFDCDYVTEMRIIPLGIARDMCVSPHQQAMELMELER